MHACLRARKRATEHPVKTYTCIPHLTAARQSVNFARRVRLGRNALKRFDPRTLSRTPLLFLPLCVYYYTFLFLFFFFGGNLNCENRARHRVRLSLFFQGGRSSKEALVSGSYVRRMRRPISCDFVNETVSSIEAYRMYRNGREGSPRLTVLFLSSPVIMAPAIDSTRHGTR